MFFGGPRREASRFTSLELLDRISEHPLGEEDDHEHEDDPEDEGPVFGVGGDEGPKQDDDAGAEERSEEGVPSAEERHDGDLHGESPEHHTGKDGGVDDHEEDSRDPAEETGEDEA